MNISLNRFPLVLLVVSCVVACGPNELLTETKKESVLDGHWSTKCVTDDKSSKIETITFKGDVFETQAVFFGDTKCTLGKELMLARVEAKYAIRQNSDSVQGAKELDIRDQKRFLKVTSAELAAVFNVRKLYGITAWHIEDEKNVTGLKTTGDEEIQKSVFTIFKKDSSGLCLGSRTSDKDGSSELNRVNVLAKPEECFVAKNKSVQVSLSAQ